MKKITKNVFRVLKNGLRDTAGRSFGVVRSGASGIARIADRGMRSFARVTTNGFRRIGGATFNGVERVGNGAGSGIARVGTAARRGISRMTDAYRRSLSRAGLGIMGVGSAAGRRFSNVAKTYMRGISRLGTAATRATSRIGQSSSVSRMGEMAVDGVSKVAEVATSVPQGISNLAADRKLQDCLLQTMCYVSSPFLNGDKTQRKRYKNKNKNKNNETETNKKTKSLKLLNLLLSFDCLGFSLSLSNLQWMGKRGFELIPRLAIKTIFRAKSKSFLLLQMSTKSNFFSQISKLN